MRLPHLVLAALLAMATAACLTPRSPDTDAVVTPVGKFRIEFAEWDEPTSELLKQQLPVAAQVLSRIQVAVLSEEDVEHGRRLKHSVVAATRDLLENAELC